MPLLIAFHILAIAFLLFMIRRPKARTFDAEVARRVVNAARDTDDDECIFLADEAEDQELYSKWLRREAATTRVP